MPKRRTRFGLDRASVAASAALAYALSGTAGAAGPPGSCSTWSCLEKKAGFVRLIRRDELDREVVTILGPKLSTEFVYGFSGELDEIRSTARSGRLISVERFKSYGKEIESYDRHGALQSVTRWSRSGSRAGWLVGREQRMARAGRGAPPPIETWVNTRGPEVEYNSFLACVGPRAVAGVDLSTVMNQIFVPADASTGADQIRAQLQGCDTRPGAAAVQSTFQASITQGIQCLMDPARGGSARGQSDAQMLFGLLTNRRTPLLIQCFNEIRPVPGGAAGATEVIPGHARVPAAATMHADDFTAVGMTPPTRTGEPRYPGISLNTLDFDISSPGNRGTIFHETMHLLGMPHTHSPDVVYACETCCFGASAADLESSGANAADVAQTACAACRTPGTPDEPPEDEYPRLFSLSSTAGDPPLDLVFQGAINQTKRQMAICTTGGAGCSPDYPRRLARSLITNACEGGHAEGCNMDVLRMAAFLIAYQGELGGATPLPASVTGYTMTDASFFADISTAIGPENMVGARYAATIVASYQARPDIDRASRAAQRLLNPHCREITDQESYDRFAGGIRDANEFIDWFNLGDTRLAAGTPGTFCRRARRFEN